MKIYCPHCNRPWEIADSYTGQMITCPYCAARSVAAPFVELIDESKEARIPENPRPVRNTSDIFEFEIAGRRLVFYPVLESELQEIRTTGFMTNLGIAFCSICITTIIGLIIALIQVDSNDPKAEALELVLAISTPFTVLFVVLTIIIIFRSRKSIQLIKDKQTTVDKSASDLITAEAKKVIEEETNSS